MKSRNHPHVWLVTGASSGLGRAVAETAIDRGDRVVATAREPARIGPLGERATDNAIVAQLDVTDPGQAVAALDVARSAFGRVDVIVNNAGYGLFGALESLTDEQVRAEFETNFFGSLNVIRAALPILREQRSGHIVQISSLDGIAPVVAGETAYAATKFATEGLCEALAPEVAHLGIRITLVEPGPIRTDFGEAADTQRVDIDDYEASVGSALEWFEKELAGKQPNDPKLIANAIIQAVDSDEPPLRLVLGEEAVGAVREKLDAQRAELDKWTEQAQGTAIAT
jgi:NAD(P)-dependent dehydrogenase (short-subunit alcohol dehydrogenase family)